MGAVLAQLRENKGGDFCGRPLFAVDLDHVGRVVHVLLDMAHGAIRITPIFRGGSDQLHALVAVEEHDRRRKPLSVRIGNDLGIAIRTHMSKGRGARTQVDPDVNRLSL